MAKFANKIMSSMIDVARHLEIALGPDTGELRMRVGKILIIQMFDCECATAPLILFSIYLCLLHQCEQAFTPVQ